MSSYIASAWRSTNRCSSRQLPVSALVISSALALTRPLRCRASALGSRSPAHDVADDRLAGHAHHIGEHLGELDIHLHKRLLHALHPAGLFGEQHVALAGYRAHNADLACQGATPHAGTQGSSAFAATGSPARRSCARGRTSSAARQPARPSGHAARAPRTPGSSTPRWTPAPPCRRRTRAANRPSRSGRRSLHRTRVPGHPSNAGAPPPSGSKHQRQSPPRWETPPRHLACASP